jgi:putative FmdB family regulatory protein
MPTYEYKCDECENTFEEMHGIDDRVQSCPRCGGKVRRLFHPVGIIFKGSGFYKTDSRASSDNGGDRTRPDKKSEKPKKTEDKDSKDKAESAQKKDDAGSSS